MAGVVSLSETMLSGNRVGRASLTHWRSTSSHFLNKVSKPLIGRADFGHLSLPWHGQVRVKLNQYPHETHRIILIYPSHRGGRMESGPALLRNTMTPFRIYSDYPPQAFPHPVHRQISHARTMYLVLPLLTLTSLPLFVSVTCISPATYFVRDRRRTV